MTLIHYTLANKRKDKQAGSHMSDTCVLCMDACTNLTCFNSWLFFPTIDWLLITFHLSSQYVPLQTCSRYWTQESSLLLFLHLTLLLFLSCFVSVLFISSGFMHSWIRCLAAADNWLCFENNIQTDYVSFSFLSFFNLSK